jgi:hypothetical protein
MDGVVRMAQEKAQAFLKDFQAHVENDKSPASKYLKKASQKTGLAQSHIALGMCVCVCGFFFCCVV